MTAVHLYLSPHFDDAILSCGGLIAQQRERGERAVVVTLCAGAPPAGLVSTFAAYQHQRWLADHPDRDPIILRKAEDEAACAVLRAEAIHLNELDCIYRRGADGVWLYDSEEALWGPVNPDDDASILATEMGSLIERLDPVCIYAPLAVGNHVDHQRARDLAETWLRNGLPVVFYEDLPYAERTQSLWDALNRPAPGPWLRLPQALTAKQVECKLRAVGCYASQLEVLFGGQFAARLEAYQTQVGAPGQAEILWQPLAGLAQGVIGRRQG